MERNYINKCLAVCGLSIEEKFMRNHPNKIIQLLNELNANEGVRFDIYHKFFGGEVAETTLEASGLSLFETVKQLTELNENVSSVEWYYAEEHTVGGKV